MASGRGKSKDVMVTDEQLAQVEYELARNRMVEENEERMALLGIRRASAGLRDACEPPKQRKRKPPSSTLENTTERRVLRSRGANEIDNANPTDQPSKEITTKLVDGDKGGRIKISKKANIYARMNKPKIKIPFNEYGQPIAPDATEFANFIGTLVRKHIPPKTVDWRDLDEEKKLLVWDHLQEFYELDSIALKYVISTSQRKWKEWKADLKNDGEDDEEDGEDDYGHRRGVANPKGSLTHQDESLATVLSVDPDVLVGGEPLGPATYEVIVNVAIKRDAALPYQYDDLRSIGDAVTRSIAWPSSKMKPYKPAPSGSSRR